VLVPLVASKFDVCVRLFIEGSLVHNDTDSKPCDCVNECEMTTFSSAISTSQMSTTTALSDILDTPDAFCISNTFYPDIYALKTVITGIWVGC